jgi:predicted negative regulator of RcsB-dependent stress response
VSQGRLDDAEPLLRDAIRVLRSSDDGGLPFVEMHLGRLLTARGDYDEAERVLRGVNEQWRASGSAASIYETSIHLADCLVRAGRPDEALGLLSQDYGAAPEETTIFDAARAAVAAKALVELGEVDTARTRICAGIEAARERDLTFDTARLLLVAARMGPPFDACLGTSEPAEEAFRILDRLGVVSVSAI